MTETARSPIKDKPLRLPGQSLEEQRRKLVEDKLEMPLLLAVVFAVFAAMEWWRYFSKQPPSPVVFTVVAVLFIGFAAWRIWRTRPRLRALKQGIEGEKAVGQFLERLREGGDQVFHDVIGGGFNVDHVLIGPAGVFTIETKTWSKPARGQARIRFDGEKITAAGREPERDVVVQARAQAAWLRAAYWPRARAATSISFQWWFFRAGLSSKPKGAYATCGCWSLKRCLSFWRAQRGAWLQKRCVSRASTCRGSFARTKEIAPDARLRQEGENPC